MHKSSVKNTLLWALPSSHWRNRRRDISLLLIRMQYYQGCPWKKYHLVWSVPRSNLKSCNVEITVNDERLIQKEIFSLLFTLIGERGFWSSSFPSTDRSFLCGCWTLGICSKRIPTRASWGDGQLCRWWSVSNQLGPHQHRSVGPSSFDRRPANYWRNLPFSSCKPIWRLLSADGPSVNRRQVFRKTSSGRNWVTVCRLWIAWTIRTPECQPASGRCTEKRQRRISTASILIPFWDNWPNSAPFHKATGRLGPNWTHRRWVEPGWLWGFAGGHEVVEPRSNSNCARRNSLDKILDDDNAAHKRIKETGKTWERQVRIDSIDSCHNWAIRQRVTYLNGSRWR